MFLSSLYDSWHRCFKMEIPKKLKKPQKLVKNYIYNSLIEEYHIFIQSFYKAAKNISKEYCLNDSFFIYLNNEGIILELLYPDKLNEKIKSMGFMRGSYLTEESCGTNVISTALEINKPVIFTGDENYCYFLQEWHSTAAPLNYHGEKKGYISIFSLEKNQKEKYSILFELLQAKTIEKIDDKYFSLYKKQCKKSLTDTRESILTLSANGLTIREISKKMNLSEAAVKYHRTKVCQQLSAANISQAIAKSIKLGYINLETIKS